MDVDARIAGDGRRTAAHERPEDRRGVPSVASIDQDVEEHAPPSAKRAWSDEVLYPV
jgi:hypothetical protein